MEQQLTYEQQCSLKALELAIQLERKPVDVPLMIDTAVLNKDFKIEDWVNFYDKTTGIRFSDVTSQHLDIEEIIRQRVIRNANYFYGWLLGRIHKPLQDKETHY